MREKRIKKSLVFVIIVLFIGSIIALNIKINVIAGITEEWIEMFDGPRYLLNKTEFVTFDEIDDIIYITGMTGRCVAYPDYILTVTYDSDGKYLWDTFFDGFESNECIEAYSIYAINQDNLSFDLQIRKTDGIWQDYNITAYQGSILEFKVSIKTTRGYQVLGAVLSLPTTDIGPMFDYIENSEQCSRRTTMFDANDEDIFFLWMPVLIPATITCTFQAKIQNFGIKKEVLGAGMGIIDNETFDVINDSLFVTGELSPAPDKPDKPDGPISGIPDNAYTYTTSTTDPNEDQIYYKFDWGDNTYSDWLGPYPSGDKCEATYTWTARGNYKIKVKAMDDQEHESDWSDPLIISMPKNKIINRPILNFLQQHPNLFPILRQLLLNF